MKVKRRRGSEVRRRNHFEGKRGVAKKTLVEFELWSKGDWPRRDVVGESFHADEIRSLFPARIPEGGQELFLSAALIPEPENPHDRNAVRVAVAGRSVGHLSRGDASLFHPVFAALVHRGLLPVTRCRIWGSEYDDWVGTDRRGRDITRRAFRASVTLTLDEWYLCVPTNEPPIRAATMLPYGAAIQVRKEENHQDVLRRYVSRQGECWVYGTLHSVTEQGARTSKELVEVRIGGQRIGDLTPAMSGEFLPVISQLAQRGHDTAARLIVKGNQVKAEVVLHATKAHQLPAEWIAANLGDPASAPVTAVAAVAAGSTSTPSGAVPITVLIPPKPRIIFQVPSGWPPPPPGWEPDAGWRPDPSWPPPPADWQFWQLTQ